NSPSGREAVTSCQRATTSWPVEACNQAALNRGDAATSAPSTKVLPSHRARTASGYRRAKACAHQAPYEEPQTAAGPRASRVNKECKPSASVSGDRPLG